MGAASYLLPVSPLSIQVDDVVFYGCVLCHCKYSIIAMTSMGVPLEAIKDFYDNQYKPIREESTSERELLKGEQQQPHFKLTPANWKSSLGKVTSYGAYLAFFDKQEKALGMKGVIEVYSPFLIMGCAGAFEKGIIHLGWALDAKNRWMTIEGLACMACFYLDIHPERFITSRSSPQGYCEEESSPFQSLLHIARACETKSVKMWINGAKRKLSESSDKSDEEHYETGSQMDLKLPKILEDSHPLMHEMPQWIDEMELSEAFRELYMGITLMYVTSAGQSYRNLGTGSPIILQLITSLWGIENVARAGLLDEARQRKLLKCFWCIAIGLLITSEDGFLNEKALQGAMDNYYGEVDSESEGKN